MPKPLKLKRTYKIEGKVFLTHKFRERVRENRKKLDEIRYIDNFKYDEVWPLNGARSRFNTIYYYFLKGAPINFFKNLRKSNPRIMVLGPGKGEYILDLHNRLNRLNINPVTDVFGLTKSVSEEVSKIINKDHSQGITFEELWYYPEKYKSTIEKFFGEYDFIDASYSTSYHTSYPEKTAFYTSLMLAKGGEAYITLNPFSISRRFFDRLKEFKSNRFFTNENFIPRSVELTNSFDKSIKYVLNYLKKAIKAYNKSHNTNLDFEFEIINTDSKNVYLKIKRIL